MRKAVLTAFAGCLLLAAVGGTGRAVAGTSGAVTLVRPTGQFPGDLTSVQAAVDRGGVVLLAATDANGQATAFNFGPAVRQAQGGRGIDIRGNVAVIGEHSRVGGATIDGGDVPFWVNPGANVTIAGITFDAPFFEAIELDDAATANVAGNVIEHVVGNFVTPTVGYAEGIDAAFGGTITIVGNAVDDVNAPFALGIEQFQASGNVLIAGNRVSQTNEIAIESGGNAGKSWIVGNSVAPGPQRYPRGAAGTGIEANGPGSFEIRGNNATCVNPNAACIFVFGMTGFFNFGPVVAPVIRDNRITAGADGVDGIYLAGQVSQGTIAGNKLIGIGQAAFVLSGCGCGDKDDLFANTFAGNRIGDFTSTLSDVFMDESTHDNVFRGECRSVLDYGIANQITCTNGPHPAGAVLKSAVVQSLTLRPAPEPPASNPQRP